MEEQKTGGGPVIKHSAITLKGLKHATHWLNNEDGECEELLNLRFKAGTWQEIKAKRRVWTYDHGCDIIHYHPLNDTESSTSIETNGFYIGFVKSSGVLKMFLPEDEYEATIFTDYGSDVTGITHLNNVLIVYYTTQVRFWIWNYDEYEYQSLDHPVLPQMSLLYEPGSTYGWDTREDDPSGNQPDYPQYFSQTVDYVNNKKKDNQFVESYVLVVAAYRLFDGSFIMHSQPLLTYVGGMQSYRIATEEGFNGYKDIRAGNAKVIISNDLFPANMANWKGLIMGLSLFMIRPLPFYSWPQSGEGYDWNYFSREVPGDVLWYMPQSKAVEDLINDPVYYRVNEVSFEELIEATADIELTLGYNPDEIKKDFAYYLPEDNFSHHRLLSEQQYIYNRRLHQASLQTIFGYPDAQLFTDPCFDETVQGVNFDKVGYSEVGISTNSFWAEVTIQTDLGKRYVLKRFYPDVFEDNGASSDGYFIPFMPVISYADPRAIKIRILFEVSDVYYEIAVFDLKPHPFMAMAYYANYEKIVTPWTEGVSNAHPTQDDDWEDPEYYGYLHKLYEISGAPGDHGYTTTTPATENRYYIDENRLQVSRIDNPFVNEAKHSYQIGGQDSRILGLATSAIQVSEGQYGEFPLFIFTNEGVYTLRQGIDPSILYQSISPVSKQRLIPGTICEINAGIVYATVDGIKLLSGTTIADISEDILLRAYNNLIGTAEYKELLDGTEIESCDVYDMIDTSDVRLYLQGAKIAYDAYNNELLLCNPEYAYSYLYSLKNGTWSKIDQVWDYFLLIPPRFYGVKGSELYDMEDETGNVGYQNFLIQTKPMKLGSQGYKTIQRVVARQFLRLLPQQQESSTSSIEIEIIDGPGGSFEQIYVGDEVEGLYLFGSIDGDEWKLIRGVNVELPSDGDVVRVVLPGSHTKLRYIILLMCGTYLVYDKYNTSFRFSHFEVSYFDSLHNKLR